MWTPAERIRHPLPETRWPTADEARASLWFSPVGIGSLELRHRTWVPAMVPWRATEDGFVTEDVLKWSERFARGKPGAIVVEATGIRDIPSGPLLRIGHDRFIPGLKQLVDTVRQASEGETRLFIQIIDFLSIRRRPPKDKYFQRFLELSDTHRARMSEVLDERQWLEADARAVRERLVDCEDSELDHILGARELEDLRYGARERVDDMHLEHPRASSSPSRHFRHRCGPGAGSGFRWRRDYGLYHGVVSFEAEPPRRRLRRSPGEPDPASTRDLRRITSRTYPRRRSDRRWQRARGRDLLCLGVGPCRYGLPICVERREVRRRETAERWLGGVSVYRTERIRVHADGLLGRSRTVREERSSRGCDQAGGERDRLDGADRDFRGGSERSSSPKAFCNAVKRIS